MILCYRRHLKNFLMCIGLELWKYEKCYKEGAVSSVFEHRRKTGSFACKKIKREKGEAVKRKRIDFSIRDFERAK